MPSRQPRKLRHTSRQPNRRRHGPSFLLRISSLTTGSLSEPFNGVENHLAAPCAAELDHSRVIATFFIGAAFSLFGEAFARGAHDDARDGAVLQAVAADAAGDEGLHARGGFAFGADYEAGGGVDCDLYIHMLVLKQYVAEAVRVLVENVEGKGCTIR